MSSFAARARTHDGTALAIVQAIFKANGFTEFKTGIETRKPDLWEALQRQRDRTSMMLRYQPDQTFVGTGVARTVLCEVKSECDAHPNFAIEADAYLAALDWNAGYQHLMYAFCDLDRGQQWGCWADDIPRPVGIGAIRVPKRRDAGETLGRLERRFGRGACQLVEWSQKGSGTAFFLVPKRSTFLIPLDQFVRDRVVAAVRADAPQSPVQPAAPTVSVRDHQRWQSESDHKQLSLMP